MDQKLKYCIDDIEYVLSAHLRPSYLMVLALEEMPGEINIIVSSNLFKGQTVQKRIAIVFNLLYSKLSVTILEEFLLVVQALDGDEMLDYLDNCFEEIENDRS